MLNKGCWLIFALLLVCHKVVAADRLITIQVEPREGTVQKLAVRNDSDTTVVLGDLSKLGAWQNVTVERLSTDDEGIYRATKIVLAPKEKVEIIFNGSVADINRMYAPMISLNGGSLGVFTRYLEANKEGVKYKFCGNASDYVIAFGRVSRGCIQSETDSDISAIKDGTYIIFSSQKPARIKDITTISDVHADRSFVNSLASLLAGSMRFYAQAFGSIPAAEVSPTLVVQLTPSKHGSTAPFWRGDHSADNVIRLNFGGDWSRAKGGLRLDLLRFVAHEAFHIWNGSIAKFPTAESHSWLHEGGAELVAETYLIDSKRITKSEAFDFLNYQINRCLETLGDRSWKSIQTPRPFGIEYSCGTLFNVMYSIGFDKNPFRGSIEFWKSILKNASGRDACANIECLLEASSIPAYAHFPKLNDLEALSGDEVRSTLRDDLRWRHIEVQASGPESEKFAGSYLGAILNPMLSLACSKGPYGFWVKDGVTILDTNDSCSIPKGTIVRRISGVKVPQHVVTAYEHAKKLCKRHTSVEVYIEMIRDSNVFTTGLDCSQLDATLPKPLFITN